MHRRCGCAGDRVARLIRISEIGQERILKRLSENSHPILCNESCHPAGDRLDFGVDLHICWERRMRISNMVFMVSMLGLANSCHAVDISLNGETSDGWEISVSAETPAFPFEVSTWKTGDKRSYQTFRNEPCVFLVDVSLTCAASAKSPLAGTKYMANKNTKGSCENGDPEFIYACVSGCDQNKRAPRKLYQGHYEC